MTVVIDGTSGINTPGVVNTAAETIATTLAVTGATTLQGLTVGKGAGAVATNTAVGASALAANTSGSNNVAVGYRALSSMTTGNTCVAIGQDALKVSVAGTENTAVGFQSMLSTLTASANSALGLNSLSNNTTGNNNTAIGYAALTANTTASNNTAVGYQAGYANTTGASNAFLGRGAGYSLTGAYSNNTAVGDAALFYTTGGADNTAIGQYALGGATTGASNTAIGSGAGSNLTTGSKNTLIGRYNGNQGSLDIRTSSNHIVLSDGDGNPRQVISSSGDVFIGTTATFSYANGKVCINADGSGNPCLVAGVNSTSAATNNIILGNSTGSVGRIQTNGSATTYLTSSDYRLKSNATSIQNALAVVASLNPITFIWNVDNRQDAGFLAHEFQEVLPNYADGTKDEVDSNGSPVYQAVDSTGAIPYLVKAIQEQQAIITQLQADVAALKGQP